MDNTIRDQQIDPPEDTRDERAFEQLEIDIIDEWNLGENLADNGELYSDKDILESYRGTMRDRLAPLGYDPKDSELYCAITNLLELL
jgi:hypothetical protein